MTDTPPTRLKPPSKKSVTAAQAERKRIIAERTKRMSERGVRVPKSNIFGGKPAAKK